MTSQTDFKGLRESDLNLDALRERLRAIDLDYLRTCTTHADVTLEGWEVETFLDAVAALLSSAEAREEALGWLYISDDGIEWSESHPVETGEVPDARSIRRATAAELLSELKSAWEAHGEAVQSEARLGARLQAAETRAQQAEARVEDLEKALPDDGGV